MNRVRSRISTIQIYLNGVIAHGITVSTYGYLANSNAIQTLTFKSGSTTRLTTTRSYDSFDRLDGVTNAYGASQLQTFGVTEYDGMNRRRKITREDATRWNYGYNDKGEVTSGIREKTDAPNTVVPGWNHGYSFDEIGNRLGTTTNGRTSTYTPNNLNQITLRTVPRAFDVIGKAATTATVTVNTLAATRLDEYFFKELPADSGAVHVPYSVAATDGTGTTTRSAGKFLPATPENSLYDLDGNLTSDGRFTYTWDAENRLIAMETLATVPVAARRKLAFAYDAMGRRIRKATWNGTASGTWQTQLDLRFLHEAGGWNILAEITADSKFLRTYTWGTDLSGSLSGAGGVGGLLFTKILPDNSIHANGIDLNGNVTLLVSTTTGQATAIYDYGPFGEPIRESGEYAKINPYRFSTKYADDETGLMDYGLRYYWSMDGRWPSRDPIGERGGINLYGFVWNDGMNNWDILGLDFIAVGSSRALGKHVPGGGHLMLTYWKDTKFCLRVGDQKYGNASSQPTGWLRGWGIWKTAVSNDATGTSDVIQLGFTPDWELKYTRTMWPFIWTEVDNPDVSQIYTSPSDSAADQYKIIYADALGSTTAAEQWAKIQAAAASYAYAEHGPFVPGSVAKNWPNSHYGHLVADGNYNNSNTFAHAMAAAVGATIPLNGWGGRSHPGNMSPVPVSDKRPAPKHK